LGMLLEACLEICVGPGREVCVISDRHRGILHVVHEQMEGYPPIHHRWCTRHLVENLLHVKDNFECFRPSPPTNLHLDVQRPICATEVEWVGRVKTETSQQSSAYCRGLLHRAGGRLAPARFASERWRSASRGVSRPTKTPRPTGITRLGSTDQQELHRPTGCPRPTSIFVLRFIQFHVYTIMTNP
jgi:hypothetical protein